MESTTNALRCITLKKCECINLYYSKETTNGFNRYFDFNGAA